LHKRDCVRCGRHGNFAAAGPADTSAAPTTTGPTTARNGQVANRPIYPALAVTVDGNRDILGMWAGDGGEGVKHWLLVLTELKNRGVTGVLLLGVSRRQADRPARR
jgi:hypothetical protein